MSSTASASSSSSGEREGGVGELMHEAEVPEQEVQMALGEVEMVDRESNRMKLDRLLLAFLERVCSDGEFFVQKKCYFP